MAGSNLHALLYMAERLKTRRYDGASAALPFWPRKGSQSAPLWTSPSPRLTMAASNASFVHHYQGDLANVGNIHLPGS
jgi:hypothetical protein